MRSFGKGLLIVSSLVCLGIALRFMYVMGCVADETCVSASVLFGGNLWLYAGWLRLLLLGICLMAGLLLADCPVVALFSSSISLLISLKLTYNSSCAIDALNLSAAYFYGGTGGLYANWGLLLLLVLILGISLWLIVTRPKPQPAATA